MGTEYTPMDIYRYLIPDLRLKLARFQSVKNKASSKRLLILCSPLSRRPSWASLFPPIADFCVAMQTTSLYNTFDPMVQKNGSRGKYTKKYRINKIFELFF